MAPTEHKRKRRAVESSDTPAKSPGESPNKKQKRDEKTPAKLSPHKRKNKKNKKHNDKQRNDQHNRVNQSTDSSDPSRGAPVNSPDTKQMPMLSRNKNALYLLAGLAGELAGKDTQEKMKPARDSEENTINLENKKGKRRRDGREKHEVFVKEESSPVAEISTGSEGGGVQIRTTTGSDDESEEEARAKRRKEKKLVKKLEKKRRNADEEADEAQKTKQNGQEMKRKQKGNQKHKAKTQEHTNETKKKEQIKTEVIAPETTDTLMKSLMTKATITNKKAVTSSPLSKTLTIPKSIGRKIADQTPAEAFLANQATSARTKPTTTTKIATNDTANREFTASSTSSTGALSSSTSAKAKSGILNSERITGASTLPPTTLHPGAHSQNALHQINPLHEKWYSPLQLKVLQQQGIVVRQGKWSELENNTLRSAIDDYLQKNNLNRANLEIMLFKDSAKKHPVFWRQIAAPLKDRLLRSIFHHVKQIYHPDNYGGKWTEEEDGQLKSLVTQYGHQWKRIGEKLGRIGSACKDRWRDYVGHGDNKTQGKWTLEEEDKLIDIVMDLTTSQGRSADSDVTWNVVSERMGTRTRDQCRTKWVEGLNKLVKNDGVRPVWSPLDDLELLQRIYDRDYQHETEIQWSSLVDHSGWNIWDARRLRLRFNSLKKRVPQYQMKNLEEILEQLINECSKERVDSDEEADGMDDN